MRRSSPPRRRRRAPGRRSGATQLEVERDGDRCGKAADRRDRHRQRGVATREMGQDVRHRASGRGAQQHEADRQSSRQAEHGRDADRERGRDDDEVEEADPHPARLRDDAAEVGRHQLQAEGDHDHRERGGQHHACEKGALHRRATVVRRVRRVRRCVSAATAARLDASLGSWARLPRAQPCRSRQRATISPSGPWSSSAMPAVNSSPSGVPNVPLPKRNAHSPSIWIGLPSSFAS